MPQLRPRQTTRGGRSQQGASGSDTGQRVTHQVLCEGDSTRGDAQAKSLCFAPPRPAPSLVLPSISRGRLAGRAKARHAVA